MLFDSSDNNGIIVVLCVGCCDVKMEAQRLILNAPQNPALYLYFFYIHNHWTTQFIIKLYDERIINKQSELFVFIYFLSHKFLQDFIYS